MKKKPASKSAFFNQRVLIGFSFCLLGLVLALLGFNAYPGGKAFARQEQAAASAVVQQSAAAPEASGIAKNFPTLDLLTPEQISARALDLPQAPDQASCSLVVLPTDGSSSANARAPATRFAASRAVYLITAAELAAAGFPNGTTPTFLGWTYFAAPVTGGSAPLTILMQNTTDVTNTKSTTWATAITGMTTVHNAVTALPGTIGAFDIPFTGGSSFTYTGGGIYVAYDWGPYAGTLSTTSSISCNTALVNGLLSANSAAATVVASNFRPETRLSSFAANNAAVQFVRGLGELPLGLVPAQIVSGVVANHGSSVLTNLPVTLNLTGANTFSNGQSIASLASCTGQGIATFTGFTPSAAGANTLTVSVPADDVAGDNTLSRPLNVTSLDYSYKHPGTTANGGVGVNGATAALIARFNVTTANAVTAVKLEFPNAVPTTAFRVAIYAESAPGSGTPATAPIFVDAADRPGPAAGPVTITLPAAVPVGPGNFFVGVQQTNTVNVGLSFDTENPIRSGAFFLAIPNGTAFFDAAPGNNFKLNIGLILQTPGPSPTPSPSPSVTPSATPTPSSTPTPSVTPSPGGVPANDQCAGAIVIPPAGPFPHLTAAVDVTNATITGDPPLPSCQTSVSRSIWYTFTPAVTGSYTISSCQTEAPASTLPDIVLAIYTSAAGCAGPFTQLAGVAGCDDDSCTTLALQAIISNTTLNAGTQYYILAHKFGAGAPVAPADDIQFRVSLLTPASPTPTPSGTITPPPSPTPGVSVVWAMWTTPATGAGTARLVTFSPTAPQTFTIIGDTGINTTSNFPNGLDFDNANNLFCTGGTNTNFWFSVNQTTGVATLIGGSGLPAAATVVDIAYDRFNNRMLGLASGTNPVLVQINTATGVATTLGTITGTTETVAVSLAVRASDGAIFMHGVATDRWYNVNPTTFVATPLAVLPFDTNFGQGGTFDPNTGTLYHAAFNSTAFQGQLYTIDPATGNSTFVGNMGDLTNPQPNQISDIAIKPSGGPSPTPFTPTPTPSVTATPCPGGTNVIVDGTFEAGTPWTAWTVQTSTNFGTPMCDAGCGTGGGTAGGFGGSANWAWFGGTASAETATAGQSVVIASGGVASLTFQLWIGAVSAPFTDVLNVRVDGTIVQSFVEPATAEPGYTQRTIDLGAFANGASHAILFEYIGPGGAVGNFSVDNVTLVAGGVCPTPSPSATASPSASPSCAPAWSAGPNFPAAAVVRAVGVYASNGRFYSIGGRSSDTAGNNFANPFEYDPVGNAWVQKAAVFPDDNVNNMACGELTVSGTPQIYCAGGSAGGGTTSTARVFSYNPATDVLTPLTGDDWPGAATNTLPGGFAVAGNKLYIIGGFAIGANATAAVWQFDPTLGVGAKWLQRQDLPLPRGYVPATTIAGLIYTGGGSDIVANTLTDSAQSFKYDPVGNTWTAIASIPRPTGETRALTLGGKMWVLSGGRTAPNPSNQVNIYDPVADSWTTGAPVTTARRNFPADTDGTRIFLAGGYDNTGTVLLNTMEIFGGGGVCATPTPSPSGTPITPTPTPTVTPSATVSPSATPSATASPSATVPVETPTPTPGVTPTPAQAVNFSTRMRVLTGDRVGIGGFIVTGSGPKNVIVRAIGPSLTRFGIDPADVLADPTLELRSSNALVLANNNWKENAAQRDLIEATGLPPTNDLESAIVATLNPGQYTAVVRGNGGTTGVALVEVYDLNQNSGSRLANISTRAFVSVDDDIVIAGFILGNNTGDDSVIVRGIGPSLTAAGVSSVLANPTLELRDHNGALLFANNDWQDDPDNAALITAAGLAPSNTLEAAIAATLPPGLYTALLAGLNGGVGNGLVEVYDLGAPPGGGPAPSPTPTPPGGTPTPTPPPASPSPGVTPPPTSPTPTPPPASPTPTPPSGPCTENFDGVTPPTLPAGWTSAVLAGDPPPWVTTGGSPDVGNNAFVADQDGISDKVLDSRSITINSASSVLTFRNNFNTEYDPPPAEVFWDGYVLEVSTDGGGSYNDVIAAGGVFVSGPYTGEIDGSAENPLAGRMAWSGNSGGYINSVINLPASFNGQTIKLRFRMGTDQAIAAPGAHVDGLSITNASCP